MKKSFLYIPLLVSLAANIYFSIRLFFADSTCAYIENYVPASGCCVRVDKRDPENTLFCKTPKGYIHYTSGKNMPFALVCLFDKKKLDFMEYDEAYLFIYGDFFGVDYNKDFVFDVFRNKGIYYIATDHGNAKIERKYFSSKSVITENGEKYSWNGSAWILQNDKQK